MRLTAALAFLALTAFPLSASAQTAAAVLMVEDQGWNREDITEPLGLALYGHFLRSGPYTEVVTVQGRDNGQRRLADAILQAARTHDVVDVFLSVHTTRRDPEAWAQMVRPAADKLRLVYSTACHGAEAERAAWEAVGPQALVTHNGINNPLLALPRILSGWLGGERLESLVTTGYSDTLHGYRFASSLPGVDAGAFPDEEGSRPTLTGDRDLRITSGLPHTPSVPRHLVYEARRGGAMGLALRALADEGFQVEGRMVRSFIDRVYLPLVLPQEALDAVVAIRASSSQRGSLVLQLRERVSVPLRLGFTLRLEERVEVWAGTFNVESRALSVGVKGVRVVSPLGLSSVGITGLHVRPLPLVGGYFAAVNVGLRGLIPIDFPAGIGFPIGGSTPPEVTTRDMTPVFRTMPPRAPSETPGLAGALAEIGR
jgi:hypothetical protein